MLFCVDKCNFWLLIIAQTEDFSYFHYLVWNYISNSCYQNSLGSRKNTLEGKILSNAWLFNHDCMGIICALLFTRSTYMGLPFWWNDEARKLFCISPWTCTLLFLASMICWIGWNFERLSNASNDRGYIFQWRRVMPSISTEDSIPCIW